MARERRREVDHPPPTVTFLICEVACTDSLVVSALGLRRRPNLALAHMCRNACRVRRWPPPVADLTLPVTVVVAGVVGSVATCGAPTWLGGSAAECAAQHRLMRVIGLLVRGRWCRVPKVRCGAEAEPLLASSNSAWRAPPRPATCGVRWSGSGMRITRADANLQSRDGLAPGRLVLGLLWPSTCVGHAETPSIAAPPLAFSRLLWKGSRRRLSGLTE
jgi:hypothetical protein